MPRSFLASAEALEILRSTPDRLAVVTVGLSDDDLTAAPSEGEWSINGVLAHLRACADVWGDAIATTLAQDHPTIRAINPRAWIDRTDYRTQAFRDSLYAFTVQRTGLLATLDTVGPVAWSRTARVTGAGAPLERTIAEFADRLARHERAHAEQVERGRPPLPLTDVPRTRRPALAHPSGLGHS